MKLWQEDEAAETPAGWRGQVVSVADGSRACAGSADEVPVLLAREIGRAGIRLGWYWRLRVVLYERQRAARGQR